MNSLLGADKKHLIGLIALLSIILLSGCGNSDIENFWDGQWSRRIQVPKGMQGRCYDEILLINKRQWRLQATVHSTFQCDQPFLEMVFIGEIDEILIKKKTEHRNMSFQVTGIHLHSMADIAKDSRVYLPEQAVAALSMKYVPEKWQVFSQKVLFNTNKTQMKSSLFKAAEMLAIPSAITIDRRIDYIRD